MRERLTARRANSDNPRVSTTLAPAEIEVEQPGAADDEAYERPWIVIVWNDPINLMSYVTLVFQKLFGYSHEKATKLMLQVHNEGKAVVSSGTQEKAESDVARLHAHGLWATMRRD
jgi:ATP-dependent Clp protease adaptor protein ClpS